MASMSTFKAVSYAELDYYIEPVEDDGEEEEGYHQMSASNAEEDEEECEIVEISSAEDNDEEQDYEIVSVEDGGEEEEEYEISNAEEFFKDLDNSVEHFILDCLQLDDNKGRDPRACHSFYQLINKHFESAIARGFLQREDSLLPMWKKYDDWAASAVKEHLDVNNEGDNSGSAGKFSSIVPVIPASAQKEYERYKQNIETCVQKVFRKSRNEHNQYNLSDLNIRLEFFNYTRTYNEAIMDHYWHRLLYSTVDQLILYIALSKDQQQQQSAQASNSLSSLSSSPVPPKGQCATGKSAEISFQELRNQLVSFEQATRDPELNATVHKYKNTFASTEWRQKLKEEKPEIYFRLLEKERKVAEIRKANFTPEQFRNYVLRTKIQTMRKYLRAKLQKEGLSTEEIEKIVAEREHNMMMLGPNDTKLALSKQQQEQQQQSKETVNLQSLNALMLSQHQEQQQQSKEIVDLKSINAIVSQYKKTFASKWRHKLKEEKREIYFKLLERERKLAKIRKGKYTPEQLRNHVQKTKIRSLRKTLRMKLRKDGLLPEEIEKIVAEKIENILLDLNGTK